MKKRDRRFAQVETGHSTTAGQKKSLVGELMTPMYKGPLPLTGPLVESNTTEERKKPRRTSKY